VFYVLALQALSMHYDDTRAVHSVFGSACYIDDSFPVVLYLAAKVRLGLFYKWCTVIRSVVFGNAS
jgi:hypothetical protein